MSQVAKIWIVIGIVVLGGWWIISRVTLSPEEAGLVPYSDVANDFFKINFTEEYCNYEGDNCRFEVYDSIYNADKDTDTESGYWCPGVVTYPNVADGEAGYKLYKADPLGSGDVEYRCGQFVPDGRSQPFGYMHRFFPWGFESSSHSSWNFVTDVITYPFNPSGPGGF